MGDYPQDIIAAAGEVCRGLDIKSTPTNCEPIIRALLAERTRALSRLEAGHQEIDGGHFADWSTSAIAAECRAQSRDQLDPEFSRFMGEVAKRLSALGSPSPAPEAEPVAWRYRMENWGANYWHYFTKEPSHREDGEIWQALYTTPIPAADAEEEEPCPICGNEERGQGGYLSCECRAHIPAVNADAVIEAGAPFAGKADSYNDIPGILRINDCVELWQVSENKGMKVDITVGDLRRARDVLRALSLPPSADKGE